MANQGLVDAGVVEPVKRYYQWEEEGWRQRQPSSSSYDERRDVNRLTYVWRTWTDRDKSIDRTEAREPKSRNSARLAAESWRRTTELSKRVAATYKASLEEVGFFSG